MGLHDGQVCGGSGYKLSCLSFMVKPKGKGDEFFKKVYSQSPDGPLRKSGSGQFTEVDGDGFEENGQERNNGEKNQEAIG